MKFVKCVRRKNILILYIIMTEFVEKPKFITNLAEDISNGTQTANIIGTLLLHPNKADKEQLIAYIKQNDRDLTNTKEGCKDLIFTKDKFDALQPIQKSRAMTLCKYLLSLIYTFKKSITKYIFCYTFVILLLYFCYTFVILLLYFCYTFFKSIKVYF